MRNDGPLLHHHDHAGGKDESAMIELLDLEAEVLHAYLSELTGWIRDVTGDRDLPGDTAPGRILDLGSGTGTGTFALLRRFPEADAVAVDLSEQFLRHLHTAAGERGLADRVSTVRADLDAAWPAVGTFDLVWASASLHHLADPDRVLADVLGALRPGGLLVAAELDSFPRLLPHDIGVGTPGLEARCHAILDEERAARLPHMGDDWGSKIGTAGFTVEAERSFSIDLKAPLPTATGRYAQASLCRIRHVLDGRLSAEDLAAVDALLDPDSPTGVLRRDDLTVRTARTVWVARRP
jgi:SAM-dependent methyltransferase